MSPEVTDKLQFQYKEIDHPRYKYQLTKDYTLMLLFSPMADIESEYILFDSCGFLTVKQGYCWDGASGPTFDTASTMRASLVHDALYQLIREKKLMVEKKDEADKELKRIMIEDSDGSWWAELRAEYYYMAVKYCGHSACKPNN